jgi:hypothetical protein
MDFFLRDGDESRLKNAQLADEMDLLYSRNHIGPWGPELVACAMRDGAHVCWYCMELFDDSKSKRRQIEVRHGYTLLLLHAGCVGKKPRTAQVFNDLVRGHQLRREATRVVKASVGLDEARGVSDSSLSLDDELFATARKALSDLDEPFAREADPKIELVGGLDTLAPRASDDGDKPPL